MTGFAAALTAVRVVAGRDCRYQIPGEPGTKDAAPHAGEEGEARQTKDRAAQLEDLGRLVQQRRCWPWTPNRG